MALWLPLVAMAQHWTAKTNQDLGGGETSVQVQLNINGVPATANTVVELAAFIGEECRADVSEITTVPNGLGRYILRVAGASSENGQDIIIRAFYDNIEYEFTTKAKFSGDNTYDPTPLVLNLDAVTGVTQPIEISIEQPATAFPYTEDLTEYITFEYNTPDGAPYEPLGESTIISPITYEWNVGNYVNQLTFEGNSLTVVPAEENAYDVRLYVYIGDYPNGQYKSFIRIPATINVTIAAIPVTSITCDLTSTDFYVMEDFAAFMADKVHVGPEDATNKGYHFECETSAEVTKGLFQSVGVFTVSIVPDDQSYEGNIPTIQVTVYAKPTDITNEFTGDNVLEVNYGQNVFEAIADNQGLSWPIEMDEEQEQVYGKSAVTYTVEYVEEEGLIDANGKAIGYGQANVTVTLVDGITPMETFQGQDHYTVRVNIVSAMSVTFRAGATELVKNGTNVSPVSPAYVDVYNPANEPFSTDDLIIQFDSRYEAEAIRYAIQRGVTAAEAVEEDMLAFGFQVQPLFVGTCGYRVIYAGDVIGEGRVTISKQDDLQAGWTWLSLTGDGGEVNSLITQADLTEVRSQQQLLWNDPVYGYVGDLTTMTPYDGMYKVKTNKLTSVNWGTSAIMRGWQSNGYSKSIRKGYNWVNYPYEFSLPGSRIGEFLGETFKPADGDRIITQFGFAEFTDGAWIYADDFELQEGMGLMYYSTADENPEALPAIVCSPALAPYPQGPQIEPVAPVKGFVPRRVADDILQYDVHAFADNMSMVAEVQDLDNPEDYTLGAFVDDECRGRGRVAVDGKMFVSAVGKSGENVTFKLVNNRTGEMKAVEGVVPFSRLQGSLRTPVMLSIPTPTGISAVNNSETNNAAAVYDLSGRRIAGNQRGISIQRMADGSVRKVVKK